MGKGKYHLNIHSQEFLLSTLWSLPAMTRFQPFFALCLILLTFTLSSCELAGDIFKAGAWSAVIGIFLVVLLVGFIIRKMRG
ncbi:hypothetical protein GCM10022406_02830 [Hymenobacter algoricola]|uniref:Phosphatidate cytidylyltransferase n=2 Tax=Hymenobacter algoricola TaxID=486267 RepID=A0ABP7MCL5_9BACT